MRMMIAFIIIILLTGCTTVRYSETRADGTQIEAGYTYWFQDKTNRATLGDFTLETTNDSDPAVEAFKQGLAAGAKGVLIP